MNARVFDISILNLYQKTINVIIYIKSWNLRLETLGLYTMFQLPPLPFDCTYVWMRKSFNVQNYSSHCPPFWWYVCFGIVEHHIIKWSAYKWSHFLARQSSHIVLAAQVFTNHFTSVFLQLQSKHRSVEFVHNVRNQV